MALKRLKGYEFDTFKVIGDTSISKAVSLAIENLLNAEPAAKNPDIVVEISAKDGLEIKPGPVVVSGRFRIVSPRIVPYKEQCPVCKGSGCAKCDYTGMGAGESAEEIISKELLSATEGKGYELERRKEAAYGFSIRVTGARKRRLDLNSIVARINKSGKIVVESLAHGQ